MSESTFESSCLETTLRTLRLRPTDILLNDSRIPANENDPLLRVARPTWIGKNYGVGGVLLLGKNPAGGSAAHREASHPSDPGLADALNQLIEEPNMANYRVWRDVAQPRAMSTWRIWRISVKAVLTALEPLAIGEHNVAFGNLVPFRTAGNTVKHDEFVRGWEQDARHIVALLQPSLIVKMTAKFQALHKYCPNIEILPFRRDNGDRRITSFGFADLADIRQWGENFAKTRTSSR
jgi:hypothetical protein